LDDPSVESSSSFMLTLSVDAQVRNNDMMMSIIRMIMIRMVMIRLMIVMMMIMMIFG
jgi:hypothetical protein